METSEQSMLPQITVKQKMENDWNTPDRTIFNMYYGLWKLKMIQKPVEHSHTQLLRFNFIDDYAFYASFHFIQPMPESWLHSTKELLNSYFIPVGNDVRDTIKNIDDFIHLPSVDDVCIYQEITTRCQPNHCRVSISL